MRSFVDFWLFVFLYYHKELGHNALISAAVDGKTVGLSSYGRTSQKWAEVLFSILGDSRLPGFRLNKGKTLISSLLAACLDLTVGDPSLSCGFAASEKVMVAISFIAGPGEAPACVHAEIHTGALLGTGPPTDHLEVPVLPAGYVFQLALVGIGLPIRATHGDARL